MPNSRAQGASEGSRTHKTRACRKHVACAGARRTELLRHLSWEHAVQYFKVVLSIAAGHCSGKRGMAWANTGRWQMTTGQSSWLAHPACTCPMSTCLNHKVGSSSCPIGHGTLAPPHRWLMKSSRCHAPPTPVRPPATLPPNNTKRTHAKHHKFPAIIHTHPCSGRARVLHP